ncbi:leucine-rich repeat domain-containing protein [Streptococcus sp. S784/96/1]|uniref:leucine-rich repeat domain-containing protein n=1 Tax=Streptococcus sp. S784/96/1 TaxID=2653499 RepID=UPI0013894BD1|nr:leucine-rich repeat domain-containing protein [Streptococcus sp. S784/96/1]
MKKQSVALAVIAMMATGIAAEEVSGLEKEATASNQLVDTDSDWFDDRDDSRTTSKTTLENSEVAEEVDDLFGDESSKPQNTEPLPGPSEEGDTRVTPKQNRTDKREISAEVVDLVADVVPESKKELSQTVEPNSTTEDDWFEEKEPEVPSRSHQGVSEEAKDFLTDHKVGKKTAVERDTTPSSEKKTPVDSISIWKNGDFITHGDCLVGLSAEGAKKLSHTDHLVLPQYGTDGTALKRVASFAFAPDKKTVIADYTSRIGEHGKIDQFDADGNDIFTEGESINAYILTKITIPEGYTHIGADAFADHKNVREVMLPKSLKHISDYAFAHMALRSIELPSGVIHIGDMAFFDNRLSGELVLPNQLTYLGERSFKSNRLQELAFKGTSLKVIGEAAFQDNDLTQVVLPNNLETIGQEAFTGNPGDNRYGNHVVLLTSDGKNPNKLKTEAAYVNPGKHLQTPAGQLDYSRWQVEDFQFQGSVILGFSEQGKQKVKHLKKLEIPNRYGNQMVTEIAANAFRNVDFDQQSLRKYDLEEVVLPNSIQKIGEFAFQSNRIESLALGESVVSIGAGAFMNNRISILDMPDSLQSIGDAAFHINHVSAIVIPPAVKQIGRSAFRQNGAQALLFLGNRVEEIGEMSFLSNALTKIDMNHLDKIQTLSVQVFADNRLEEVILPTHLRDIKEEAFHANQLSKLQLPETVERIAFNAFTQNGVDGKRVNIHIVGDIESHLPDGEGHVINPDRMATNRDTLSDLVAELRGIDLLTLRASTQQQFKDIIRQGDDLLTKKELRQGEQWQYIQNSRFFMGRLALDRRMKEAEAAINGFVMSPNVSLLQEKYAYALRSYNNSALSLEQVSRLEKELFLLTGLVNGKGILANASLVQGVYRFKSPLPLPEYYIGLNVYLDAKGTIIYILDRSTSIGQGQLDSYGNPVVNVDEDNEGYHVLALESLPDYEGLTVDDIRTKALTEIVQIRTVPKAVYHRQAIFETVKDAAKEWQGSNSQDDAGRKDDSKKQLSTPKKQEFSSVGAIEAGMSSRNAVSQSNQSEKTLPKTGEIVSHYWLLLGTFLIMISSVLEKMITLWRQRHIK